MTKQVLKKSNSTSNPRVLVVLVALVLVVAAEVLACVLTLTLAIEPSNVRLRVEAKRDPLLLKRPCFVQISEYRQRDCGSVDFLVCCHTVFLVVVLRRCCRLLAERLLQDLRGQKRR